MANLTTSRVSTTPRHWAWLGLYLYFAISYDGLLLLLLLYQVGSSPYSYRKQKKTCFGLFFFPNFLVVRTYADGYVGVSI